MYFEKWWCWLIEWVWLFVGFLNGVYIENENQQWTHHFYTRQKDLFLWIAVSLCDILYSNSVVPHCHRSIIQSLKIAAANLYLSAKSCYVSTPTNYTVWKSMLVPDFTVLRQGEIRDWHRRFQLLKLVPNSSRSWKSWVYRYENTRSRYPDLISNQEYSMHKYHVMLKL